MRRTRLALPLLLALAALGSFAVPADAVRRGSCIPGKKRPKCLVWTGKVMAVADGDTVNVRVWEGGHWSVRKDIRLLALQAMELTDYSRKHGRKGECHSVAAAERLEFLLQGRRVKRRKIRIASFRASSRTAGRRGRLRRGIAFKSGGHWHDVGAMLMKEGHALWDPNGKEWAWNRRYGKLAARAASQRVGLWDTDYCGSGPREGAPLGVGVRWDAPHNDGRHVNGEWVRIRNHDPVNPLSLHRWWVRDSALRRFRLPSTRGGAAGPLDPRARRQGDRQRAQLLLGPARAGLREREAGPPRDRRRRLPVRSAGRHARVAHVPVPARLCRSWRVDP